VIAMNASRIAKNLFTEGDEGERIRLYAPATNTTRTLGGERTSPTAQRALAQLEPDGGLLPHHAQSRVLERRCCAPNPYRVISACVSTIARRSRTPWRIALDRQSRDEASARRVINEPKRGIGPGRRPSSVRTPPSTRSPSPSRRTTPRRPPHGKALLSAEKFSFMLDELRAMSNDLAPREMIDAIVRETGMATHCAPRTPTRPIRDWKTRRTGVGGLAVRHADGFRRTHGVGGGLGPARRGAGASP